MSKRSKSSNNSVAPFAVGMILLAACGGYYVFSLAPKPSAPGTNAPKNVPDAGTNNPIVTPPPPASNASTNSNAGSDTITKVTLYDVSVSDDGFARLTPQSVTIKPTPEDDAPAVALSALAHRKDSALPPGTGVRSVKIEDGTATVNFTKDFVDKFGGGDQNEALALNAVTATLSQFKNVKRVQILVDGEKIDSLGGTQSLREPLPVIPLSEQTASDESGQER